MALIRSSAFVALACSALFSLSTHAAPGAPLGDFWTPAQARSAAGTRSSRESAQHLDETALRQYLQLLPAADTAGSLPLSLPQPDGSRREFEVSRSLVMSPGLAAKFPDIQTFQGYAVDGSAARVRFEMGPLGFSAMQFAPEGVSMIDPDGAGTYISFAREHRAGEAPFVCEVHSDDQATTPVEAYSKALVAGQPEVTGGTLRTYRAAIAATGEYTATFGGTVAFGMAGVVSALNRVNQVYETELALRLVLVPNNDKIVYTDGTTDPYTNNSGSTMLGENQTNLTAQIGAANYDFGHVFSTGGGGVANLSSVCNAGSKARGVTGRGAPNFDPFWIDYVVHEMGHQLNAPHTFNATTSNCGGGNRSAAQAYEVGSGSTIMAYAGICGAEDLQPNSDPFFHVGSLQTIHTYTQTGTGSTCGTTSSTGNNPPVLTATPNATIPARTPFALTAIATDPDGDALTYMWDEFDLDPTGSTAATVNVDNGLRPLFRSFDASSSPTRLFPRLQNILSNTQTIGEVLPTTNRSLKFRAVVRDNRNGGGGVQWTGTTTPAVAQTTLTVVDTGAGFALTAPNTATSWASGSTQTVTWAVAGTTANGINCANVDLAFSTDGGQSFPITLLAATANDGTQDITVPAQATTAGRIRITCSDNIFFDINDADITVTGGNASPVLTLPGAAVTFTTNGAAVLLDTGATISDGDSTDFAGGALTLMFSNNGEANDRLEVRNQGAGAGQIGVSGATVSFAGTPIGTLGGGVGTIPLVIAFNAAATPAAAQALLRNITYRNVSAIAGTLARTLTARVSDGDGGNSSAASKQINIAINANPFVVSIDDGDADNLVAGGTPLNYVIAFSKDVDLTSISSADFANAGTSSITLGAISEPSPGVVNLAVTPTTSGTLILQIPASATILDATGLSVPTPFQDNDTITVDATRPTLVSIDDGDADNIVTAGDTLTYVVSLSEDINLASVTAADFDNAGSSAISIGAITEPTPGVINVPVTATSAGTLILRIPATAVINDVAGNSLLVPLQDGDTITVNPALADNLFADGFE